MTARLSNRECVAVRLSALGDAILTTGVLEYWRQQAGLTFHVLTRLALAPVFALAMAHAFSDALDLQIRLGRRLTGRDRRHLLATNKPRAT